MIRRNRIFVQVLIIASIRALLFAGQNPPIASAVASSEPGWPQWRGPRRDGISDETDLLPSWPEDGPHLLWTATGLGRGYSSPVIGPQTIFITGDQDGECRVFALDLNGKLKWKASNGKAWTRNYRGARASGTYSAGRVYHMNAHGRVAAFEANSGKELWHAETLQTFDATVNPWGLSESVLIHGDRVYVTPGGRKAFMAALDRATGATVWAGEPLPNPDKEKVGYASPILVTFHSREILVTLSQRSIVGVDAADGKVLWRFAHPTKYNANCATPVLWRDAILHTNPCGSGSVLLRMLAEDTGGVSVQAQWHSPMDNISGGAVIVDSFVYGSAHNNYKGDSWRCLDARTGEVKWESTDLAQGSVIYADGRLYCLAEDGTAALVKASPTRFEMVGRFVFVEGKKKDVWTHPVLLHGRLYLRYHDELRCYDVKGSRADLETRK